MFLDWLFAGFRSVDLPSAPRFLLLKGDTLGFLLLEPFSSGFLLFELFLSFDLPGKIAVIISSFLPKDSPQLMCS